MFYFRGVVRSTFPAELSLNQRPSIELLASRRYCFVCLLHADIPSGSQYPECLLYSDFSLNRSEMAEIATNFPPQTYSSSFFLNRLGDEEKAVVSNGNATHQGEGHQNEVPFFDCFISTFLFGERRSTKTTECAENKNNSKKEHQELCARNQKCIRSSSGSTATLNSNQSRFKPWRNSSSNGMKSPPTDTKQNINHSNGFRNSEEDMSLLKFLAINALDLSAPASDVLLKSRSCSWFQLSGHPDSLAPAGPGTVWKKRSGGPEDTERIVYEELSRDPDLCDIIPKYFREVDYQGEKFIELQNLLHGFHDPYVIDVKMGTRTFLESEVRKSAARNDLYQKMIAIDPRAPSQEEHRQRAVTKLRYMQFRELQSSTCRLGFRIEAMKCRGSAPVTDLKKVKSSEAVLNTLEKFLRGRDDVREKILKRLCEIRAKIERSEYFKSREVVGSSLFIIYDDFKVGVWLIDFAKTNKLPNGMTVDHRRAWSQGNHEEGLLFGMDRLITMIESLESASIQQ